MRIRWKSNENVNVHIGTLKRLHGCCNVPQHDITIEQTQTATDTLNLRIGPKACKASAGVSWELKAGADLRVQGD